MPYPTQTEREFVEGLQTTLDLEHSPVDQLLVLAQLQVEPMHQDAEAITTLQAILARDKCNAWAVYWLAYCFLYYLMDDEALERAKRLIESHLSDCANPNGALYSLLAEILDDLNGPWRPEAGLVHETRTPELLFKEVDLLQKSILLEPNWVHNRLVLAWAYERLGRIDEAIAQLLRARDNVVSADPSWDLARYYFEVVVTGRIRDPEDSGIKERLDRLEKLRKRRSPAFARQLREYLGGRGRQR